MTTRNLSLTQLSAIAAGAAMLAGCGGEDVSEGESDRAGKAGAPEIAIDGEGEGEGGGSDADPASDDVEFLHRLGQVRGHLAALVALHGQGAHEMAATHAKHPESELYADLVPAFRARGLPGFADELDALVDATTGGGDISAAYGAVKAAIAANEPDVGVKTRLLALAAIAQTAADEFAIGVAADGAIVNAHEYQDAYGFLTAARESLSRLEGASADETAAIALAGEQIDRALGEFGDLTGQRADGKAEVLYGAAARIEIAALGL